MNRRLTWGGLLALLALLGCQGGGTRPDNSRARLTDFLTDGQPASSVNLTSSPTALDLYFTAIPADGCLLHLELPPNQTVAGAHWSANDRLLQLVAPVPGGADIGLVPLPGRSGRLVSLHLGLAPAPRAASTPPSGIADALIDLAIEQGSSGQVRLSWTEVSRGDYDANGEVNVSDLVPLAKFFGQQYDTTAPDKADHPVYWVDGDQNGEVNLGDLTVISQHYHSEISGYNVQRNGIVQFSPEGQLPTIPRSAAQLRTAQGLPPRYVIALSGSLVDDWTVTPVDSGGTPGDGNAIPPLPVDLSVQFTSIGMSLFNLDDGSPGAAAPGHSRLRMVSNDEILRIIDPIDDPSGAELGNAIGPTTGSAGFNGLPRGQWVLLQILLAPTVDPVTGQPLIWPTDGSPPHYIALHVPVKLPPGTLSSELDVSTAFTRLPGNKYAVRVASQLRAGPLHLDTISWLDYSTGLVTADTDGDQHAANELALADPRLCGLSTARLEQLEDDNDYAAGTRDSATVTGSLAKLLEADGFITTDDSVLTLPAGSSSKGTLTLRLDELSGVDEAIVSASGEVKRQIGPADLHPGDNLRLSGYLLDGAAGLPPRLWATTVTRVVDISKPDKLYAWPDRTAVFPGEAVTITLSADQTAHPLFALRGVRLTYNNATYVPDSFNAGAPGGGRADADGIWSAITGSSLSIPNEFAISELPLPDGRTGLDLYVIPQEGTELAAATGTLLNFQLSVTGPVTLGIQRLDISGVKRSYYNDALGQEYFWSDDYNAGVPMITVKDPGNPGGP